MKTAIFIPSRVSSTRLKNKPLSDLCGKPAIEFLINQIKSSSLVDIIVLCSTTNKEDNILSEIAKRNNIEFFSGSEKDIIERYVFASRKYIADFIVNVDGDDIFCDPFLVDKTIEVFYKTKPDVVHFVGFPFGSVPFGFTEESLECIFRTKKENNTETGWGSYFLDKEKFNIETIKATGLYKHPEIRMTLDYPEDLQFFRETLNKINSGNEILHLNKIIKFLLKNPEIIDINKKMQEKYLDNFEKVKANGC